MTQTEGIDCHLAKGGYLNLARNEPQVKRVHELLDYYRKWSFGEEDYRWLTADEASARLNASNVLGAGYTPHCAAIHPARLVRGLAETVEKSGVDDLREDPRGRARQPQGPLRDRHGHRPTWSCAPPKGSPLAYPGQRRTVAPIYSLMIATEPLPDSFFDEVGWAQRETFNDDRRLIIYGQRTVDNRIAFGGRGAPYHFGSAIKPEFDRHADVQDSLRAAAERAVPDARRCQGHPSLGRTDRRATRLVLLASASTRRPGQAWAGGYVGDGVTTTNLAGRTLADLITAPRDRSGDVAVGQPPVAQVGAGATALARHQRDAAATDRRRPLRGAHQQDRASGAARSSSTSSATDPALRGTWSARRRHRATWRRTR